MFSETVSFSKHRDVPENVHKLAEIVDEMLNDFCYINICPILDGYRVMKLWGIEFQEVKVFCFVAVTSVCVSIS
jgi:hypothetical protein